MSAQMREVMYALADRAEEKYRTSCRSCRRTDCSSAAYVILSFTARVRALTSNAAFKELKYPISAVHRQSRVKRRESVPPLSFQYRVIPVEIWSLGEVLPVQVQALSETQQLAQFLDKSASAHAWFPCLF